jgi:hypothetical protein
MAKKLLTGADLSNQKITNLADPSNATDGATKQYVDNLVGGLSFKDEVRAATTANGTLATAFASGQSLDGIVLATGNRILLKDQTTQSENGIYVVAVGAPTRAPDADSTAELNNATVFITEGTVNGGRVYTQTTKAPVVGTNPILWAQFAIGQVYTAGNGISLASNIITAIAKAGGGLIVDGTGIYIDPAYSGLAKRYAVDVPAGSTTPAITHGLGTKDVIVAVFINATGEEVEVDVTRTSTTVVTLGFATAPAAGVYRCVVTA